MNNERLAKLNSYVSNREVAEKNKAEMIELDVQEKLVILDSYADRIREIVEVAKFCLAHNIEIGQDLRGMNFSTSIKHPNDFFADSWFHFIGIICNHPSYSVYEPIGVGVREGGANGDTDLIVTESGVISYNKAYGHFKYDYERFVKNFDEFEKRFLDYIDNLKIA